MNRKTSRLCLCAMLSAMCAVFGYISMDMGNIKFTIESFPVILVGLMYGPVDGAIVGGIGTFLYQFLKYGFSATTVLWILPYIICGALVGFFAKRSGFYNSKSQIILICVISELLICALNTVVLYIDSKIYGYYSFGYIFGTIFVRIGIAVIKSLVFGLILPRILKALAPVTRNGYGSNRRK